MITKAGIRNEMKAKLEAQSPADRQAKSLIIKEKLFKLPAFKQAACVSLFVSTETEVDTHAIIDQAIEEGKKVLVPSADLKTRALTFYQITSREADLRAGVMGIREPHPEKARKADLAEIDVIIVPGLVYDRQNYRVGYGGGFYDKFLAALDGRVTKVGIAYDIQVTDRVPVEAHDRPVDILITDKE